MIEVTRGSVVESRHIVHVAVAEAGRRLVASSGDPGCVSFVRSAVKMFQALPLVEDGVSAALALTEQELALCAASHNAEPFHVDAARRLLAKARVSEDALACGPHEPMYPPAAEALRKAGERPGRIHNNCSGKHAGMLALAQHHGWPIEGYHRAGHAVQQRVLKTLAAWCEVDAAAIEQAVDGCGLPTFALPLGAVALACAKFAAARPGEPAYVIGSAMSAHPEFVAGTGRLCTELMTTTGGRLFAKVGAEGYYCVGVPKRRLGVALKVEDGAKRASEPALLAVLRTLEILSDRELDSLHHFANPPVVNTRGETVGEVRARIQLTTHSV